MNISKFIENHRELKDMPYLVVYATIKYLSDKGLLITNNAGKED